MPMQMSNAGSTMTAIPPSMACTDPADMVILAGDRD
jgi:hypothetical protein